MKLLYSYILKTLEVIFFIDWQLSTADIIKRNIIVTSGIPCYYLQHYTNILLLQDITTGCLAINTRVQSIY